ncbi:MAG: mycofactocin biosynthesis peptidyl-dipeptidase MftE, partial [Ilumatobacter sp.]|nr:mycofactocin biosynthesis peptidyl-dipeptidase MftE [Ilumatobacter sp.]
IGSTEQHGPHLPVSTDTLIAEEIVARAMHLTDGLMVGPTLTVTASGEHAGFPGTLSIGTAVMHDVILELGRSADWAAGVVFVNGHGGNASALTAAVSTLRHEGRHVLSWSPKWPQRADGGAKDLHAGRIETSLMLAIDPGLVRLELAEPGIDADIEELQRVGVQAVSASGVLGDPTGASGGEGDQFITTFVNDLVHAIEAWRPIDPTPIG